MTIDDVAKSIERSESGEGQIRNGGGASGERNALSSTILRLTDAINQLQDITVLAMQFKDFGKRMPKTKWAKWRLNHEQHVFWAICFIIAAIKLFMFPIPSPAYIQDILDYETNVMTCMR